MKDIGNAAMTSRSWFGWLVVAFCFFTVLTKAGSGEEPATSSIAVNGFVLGDDISEFASELERGRFHRIQLRGKIDRWENDKQSVLVSSQEGKIFEVVGTTLEIDGITVAKAGEQVPRVIENVRPYLSEISPGTVASIGKGTSQNGPFTLTLESETGRVVTFIATLTDRSRG